MIENMYLIQQRGSDKMKNELIKFPRTKHIVGSRLQTGDEGLRDIPFEQIKGKYVVLEEKMDGANCGLSFSREGELLLQSRGLFLNGDDSQKQFYLLKDWANKYAEDLYQILGNRYIMYGEWLYAKHTIFYDSLPYYFMEFDLYDKIEGQFLSTKERRKRLEAYPFIHSVRVLYEGKIENIETIINLIKPSPFISKQRSEQLKKACEEQGLDYLKVVGETDLTGMMEGIYIKIEEEPIVTERYKFVRDSFKTQVVDTETHWQGRTIIPNQVVSSSHF